jgi:ActR/RegA family two-component response regulator
VKFQPEVPVLLVQNGDVNEPDLPRVLKHAGFTVWIEHSLDAAVAPSESRVPRFIIVDIPSLKDEIESLVQRLKRRFPPSILVGKIPCDHLYGVGTETLAFFKKLGFHHIMLKPIHPDALLATLESNL